MPAYLNKQKICVSLLLVITLLQLLSLLGLADFSPLIALCALLLPLFAFSFLSAGFKKMALLFFSLGIFLNILTGQPLETWLSGINYMLNIACILVIMQLFTIPIKLDNYAESLHYLILRSFKNERALYFFTLLLTHLFASFLLFGTIPVMLSLLQEPLAKTVSGYQKFMATSIIRSYAMVVLWAPGAVNILLVSSATGASWEDMLPLGLLLSASGLILAYLEAQSFLAPADFTRAQASSPQPVGQTTCRKLGVILLVVILLILLIIIFDRLHIGQSTSRVMLASLILATLWLATFLKNPRLTSELKEYLNARLLKTVDLAVLYVALGLFSKALDTSGLLAGVSPYLEILAARAGLFLPPLLALLVLLFSLLGLHPFIILVVLGQLCTSLSLPVSAGILAVSLIFGSAVSYMVSPFAGMILTCAKYLEISPAQIGLG